MRFYKNQLQFYIGIDLHARTMYICVINNSGKDIVVGVECIFTWYWVADFCAEQGIDFALGHAYYMKSIDGGKTKSDKIGNVHLKWAFSEGAVLFLRNNQHGQRWHDKFV